MSSSFKPTRLLGYIINTDMEKMLAREVSPTGHLDEDISLLQSLRVVKKNRKGGAPEYIGTPDEIKQFFRWAAGSEKYPLPPLVRRILCMRRFQLIEAMEALKTTDPMRTYERNAIAEIDRFLREDGMGPPPIPETKEACEIDGAAKEGSWSHVVLPVPEMPKVSSQCDFEAILKRLGEMKVAIASGNVEVLGKMNEILKVLGTYSPIKGGYQREGETEKDVFVAIDGLMGQIASGKQEYVEKLEEILKTIPEKCGKRAQIAELEAKLAEAETAKINAEKMLKERLEAAATNSSSSELKEKVKNVTAKLIAAQDALVAAQKREADAEIALKIANEKVVAARANADQKIARADDELAEANERAAAAETALAAAQQRTTDAENELVTAKTEYNATLSATQQSSTDAATALEAANVRIAELQKRIQELEEQLLTTEQQGAVSIRDAQRERDAAIAAADQARQRAEAATERAEEAKRLAEEARQRAEEATQQAQQERIKAIAAQQRAEDLQTVAEREKAEAFAAATAALKKADAAEKEAQRLRTLALEAERRAVEAIATAQRERDDAVTVARSEQRTAELALHFANEEARNAKSNSQAAKAAQQIAEEAKQKAEEATIAATAVNQQMQEQIQRAQNAIKTMDTNIQEKERLIRELQQRLENERDICAQKRSDLEISNKTIADLQKDKNNSLQRIKELEEQIQSLQNKIRKCNEDLIKSGTNKNTQQTELASLQTKLEKALADLESERKRLSEKQGQIQTTEELIQALSSELDSTKKNRNSGQAEIERLQKELEQEKRLHAENKTKLIAAEQAINKTKKLSQALIDAEQRIKNLEQVHKTQAESCKFQSMARDEVQKELSIAKKQISSFEQKIQDLGEEIEELRNPKRILSRYQPLADAIRAYGEQIFGYKITPEQLTQLIKNKQLQEVKTSTKPKRGGTRRKNSHTSVRRTYRR